MDTVLAIVRRLTLCAVALLVLAGMPEQAHAAVPTQAQALTNCKADIAGHSFFASTANCQQRTGIREYYVANYDGNGRYTYCSLYDCAWVTDTPPADPCSGLSSGGGSLAGKVLEGYSFCTPSTAVSGKWCKMSVTPSGPPTMNQWGTWSTAATWSPTGSQCGDGSSDTGMAGPNGSSPPAPTPPNPNTTPPQSPPPKKCGGGSCYDPNTDSFCMVDAGGAQTCVPGGAARGDQGGANAGTPSGNPPGACISSGDSTICAGSPTAPTPSPSNVPDPPTAATNHDTYTQANPSTGSNQTIVVNTYTNQGGTPTTSGQKAGDTGPARSSSAPAPSSSTAGSYSGGGDCASPPICQGDAVMCGIAKQEWTAMCQAKADAAQLHKDLAGSGPPSDLDALKTKYGQGDVWGPAGGDGSQDGTVGGQANAGIYDQSGFGFGTTCPLKDMTISLGSHGSFVIPLQDKCVVGDWLRALVVGFALFGAAIITAGGRGE